MEARNFGPFYFFTIVISTEIQRSGEIFKKIYSSGVRYLVYIIGYLSLRSCSPRTNSSDVVN